MSHKEALTSSMLVLGGAGDMARIAVRKLLEIGSNLSFELSDLNGK